MSPSARGAEVESTRREADRGRDNLDEYLAQQSIQLRRWALGCACGLYLMFTLMDVIRFPQEVLTIILPARILLVWLPLVYGTWVFWTKRQDDFRHHLPLLTYVFVASGLVNCLIRVVAWQAGYEFGQLGMMLVLTYGCLLLGLPLMLALIGSVVLLCCTAASLWLTAAPAGEMATFLIILSLHAMVCLIINRICQGILLSNHRLISRLRFDAHRDELTGLFNKRYFNRQFETLIRRAESAQLPAGLMVIDIDNFKQINDSIGHLAADQVLKKMEGLLNGQRLREDDFVARFGGDEFIIYLHNCQAEEIEQACRSLVGTVRDHLVILSSRGQHTHISLSIGAAFTAHARAEHAVSLLQAADEALYEAKASGRNRYCIQMMDRDDHPFDTPAAHSDVERQSAG